MASSANDADRMFTANTRSIPPLGTEVFVILGPRPAAAIVGIEEGRGHGNEETRTFRTPGRPMPVRLPPGRSDRRSIPVQDSPTLTPDGPNRDATMVHSPPGAHGHGSRPPLRPHSRRKAHQMPLGWNCASGGRVQLLPLLCRPDQQLGPEPIDPPENAPGLRPGMEIQAAT